MSVTEGAEEHWRQRTSDLSWREIDEEVIVLDLRSANYLRLNPAGALLWLELETGSTRGQLARALTDRFGLDQTQALSDTDAFLRSCTESGLVERSH